MSMSPSNTTNSKKTTEKTKNDKNIQKVKNAKQPQKIHPNQTQNKQHITLPMIHITTTKISTAPSLDESIVNITTTNSVIENYTARANIVTQTTRNYLTTCNLHSSTLNKTTQESLSGVQQQPVEILNRKQPHKTIAQPAQKRAVANTSIPLTPIRTTQIKIQISSNLPKLPKTQTYQYVRAQLP